MKIKKEPINKVKLMNRAWYLVKNRCYSISYALKTVWKELKEAIENKIRKLEISETVQYSGSTFKPSAATMQTYYNSNAYKGD